MVKTFFKIKHYFNMFRLSLYKSAAHSFNLDRPYNLIEFHKDIFLYTYEKMTDKMFCYYEMVMIIT